MEKGGLESQCTRLVCWFVCINGLDITMVGFLYVNLSEITYVRLFCGFRRVLVGYQNSCCVLKLIKVKNDFFGRSNGRSFVETY